MTRGGSIERTMHPLFQEGQDGSIPIPPLSAKTMRVEVISFDEAARLNRLWHSRLPRMTDRLVTVSYAACGPNGIAYAIAIWSHPVARLLPQDTWLELRRLAVAPDAPRNTASWMISVMSRLIRRSWPHLTTLVSYQDTEVHTGAIYRAAGWIPTVKTDGQKGKHAQWSNKNRLRNAAQSTAVKQRWEKVIREEATP